MKTCTVCGTEWTDDTRFCPNDGTTLRSVGGTDLIGSVIQGVYHIEKKLGEGGMGAVYLGEHVKMGRKSAIKVMAQSMAGDPEAVARFNREATNAAKINHPNVCAIYDFGETEDGLIFLAMELIDGESLSAVLRRQGALAPQRAMMILRQTADALQAAHDLGIVHRDLKPDNIMLARGRGGADVVKVVDFGIAKAMTGEEGQQVTKTGLVVGTPEYMSPEQISGDVLDGRSDIYSLALVFFRMLTGTLPFQAGTAQEAMIKRLTDDPLPLSDAAPDADFPATLQQVLDRALARMPADRYVSATAFAGDAARAVAALAPTSGATVTEAATELLDTSATTQLPDTRISEASTRGPAATTPQTPLPSASLRPPVRKARWPAVVGAVAVVAIGGGTAYAMLGRGGESRTPGETGTPQDTSGQPSAATPSPELGPVVRDSQASVPSATQQQPLQPPRAGASNQPESGAERVAHPVTVWERLNGMYDSMESGLLTTAVKDSLTTWYADASLPDSTRAKAASLVAFWLSESGENETSILCPWYERAFNLDPARYENLYQAFCR